LCITGGGGSGVLAGRLSETREEEPNEFAMVGLPGARSGEDGPPGDLLVVEPPTARRRWARRRLAVAARSPTAELVQTTESLGVILTAYLVSTCKLMAIGELEVSRLCV
jgi:hypothetical protein